MTKYRGPDFESTMTREQYEYDGYGRLSAKTNPWGAIGYAYDGQGRIVQAGFRAYDYDADGNRTKEYFTASAVRPSGVDASIGENTSLVVTGVGKALGKGHGTVGGVGSPFAQEEWSVFEYRADNRLSAYSDSQGEAWTYRYDGFGRRYEKERSSSADASKDVYRKDATSYLGLSLSVLEVRTEFEYWNDATTQTGARFLIGPGGSSYASIETWVRNGREWKASSWANRRYYHYDRLGSLSSVSLDKPGLSGANYAYTPFGQPVADSSRYQWEDSGSKFVGFEHLGFTGQRVDYESGNLHFPFREYDPLSASWTTEDPIKDGELWFAYVGNNPVNYVDPSGLQNMCLDEGSGSSSGSRSSSSGATSQSVTPNTSAMDLLQSSGSMYPNVGTEAYDIALTKHNRDKMVFFAILDTANPVADFRDFFIAAKDRDWIGMGLSAVAVFSTVGDVAADARRALRVMDAISDGADVAADAARVTGRVANASDGLADGLRLTDTVDAAGSVADDALVVGRHGSMPAPRPAGMESHHGVNSVWMEANVPGYSANNAPAILMKADPSHNATRSIFNSWRADIAAQQGVSPLKLDWTKVSPGQAWGLAERQFQAAGVTNTARQQYWNMFNQYLDSLGGLR
ncbi:MAG TPA: RHS repeat-associated core domain-containing protein [Spirochaetales bacterium]|nr:RHS repeat-associated core domain-containing protein [Spirochaetales bacterium]